MQKGNNVLEISFISDNNALNRSKEYLYTLFVPDRASTVFPCFDQPDLKAVYTLNLSVPKTWIAVSNSSLAKIDRSANNKTLRFNKTALISTYHFAFAAGEFQKLSRTKNGRTLNFYHRQTNKKKIAHNIDEIFDLHFKAIDWMEEYTGIPYPFEKLDFVAIPSFQFSGMEHVDAIFYRESRLFLSKSATTEEKMQRAMVISHETSHMWFGDLVTMKWFDDVWLKEVFANFIAAKMVKPFFPNVNQNLYFINTHFPRAYMIDRTKGTHPIKQKLENLLYAGTLYGKIIYDKAPIMMVKLERLMGKDSLREGLKQYLNTYRFGNADWSDLIKILDKRTDIDLQDWSSVWVEQAGMPHISSDYTLENNKIISFSVFQDDLLGKNRIWKQNLTLLYSKNGEMYYYYLFLDSNRFDIKLIEGMDNPDFILINGDGYGYGYFELDPASQKYLLKNVCNIKYSDTRAFAYMALYQAVLNYKLSPVDFFKSIMCSLDKETEYQNIPLLLSFLRTTWWYFLTQKQRIDLANEMESILFQLIKLHQDKGLKSLLYQTLSSSFISKETTLRFYDIWKNKKDVNGLKLSSADYTKLAYELLVRNHPNSIDIANEQLSRITNEEQKLKLKFILPAVLPDEKSRDKFFKSLEKQENRQHEIWVRTALYYLNHPLWADKSVKYLRPSLEMLSEIQRTGDIFFPKNWLVYTVGRYSSTDAAKVVRTFLKEHPDYNKNLKAKILQFSDLLFRAEKIKEKYK
ncbi:MAG: aminopeptidase [Bacteroidales bacterium]|nr:aminopeptidase [Bacteroidales bacterium]